MALNPGVPEQATLAEGFGIRFDGNSSETLLGRWADHPITAGMPPVRILAGSMVFQCPDSATPLGSLGAPECLASRRPHDRPDAPGQGESRLRRMPDSSRTGIATLDRPAPQLVDCERGRTVAGRVKQIAWSRPRLLRFRPLRPMSSRRTESPLNKPARGRKPRLVWHSGVRSSDLMRNGNRI